MTHDDIGEQYATSEPLQVRIETHLRYEERVVDLDAESASLLRMTGIERVLDVGCGPGRFLTYLRRHGHTGRLTGLDQSVGMIAEARAAWESASFDIEGVVGDAGQLPFADGEFERVVARHMLYHVADIPSALRELDRVASSAMLLSTGSARAMPFIEALLRRTLDAFGFSAHAPVITRFSTENAGELLDAEGLRYHEHLIDNALVFHEAEPVVRYVMSCLPSFGIVAGGELYAEMHRWVTEQTRKALRRAGGMVRDPKQVGFFLVTKA